MSREDGGAAFPREYSEQQHTRDGTRRFAAQEGLSLRDYLASHALAGVMTNAQKLDMLPDEVLLSAAKQCYRIADAMLEARK